MDDLAKTKAAIAAQQAADDLAVQDAELALSHLAYDLHAKSIRAEAPQSWAESQRAAAEQLIANPTLTAAAVARLRLYAPVAQEAAQGAPAADLNRS